MNTVINAAKGKAMSETWCGWEPNQGANRPVEGTRYDLHCLTDGRVPDDNLGIIASDIIINPNLYAVACHHLPALNNPSPSGLIERVFTKVL